MFVNVKKIIDEPFIKSWGKLTEKQIEIEIDGETRRYGYIENNETIYEQIRKGKIIDLSCCYIENFSMKELKSHKKINSINCLDTIFAGPTDFSDTLFEGPAIFEYVIFTSDINFNSASFLGRVFFNGIEFSKDVNFEDAQFLGHVEFDTEFKVNVNFMRAEFKGELEFMHCKANIINFKESSFFGHVYFQFFELSKIILIDASMYGSIELYGDILDEDDFDVCEEQPRFL